jgi:hypothetical protein
MDLLPAYRELLVSPDRLDACASATTVAELLHSLRGLWPQAPMDDGALIAELDRCNRQVLELDPAALAGRWFPADYQARTRSLDWCLPVGHATEPFQDQYLSRCLRGRVFNQLIRPRTAIAPLLAGATVVAGSAPAGFIFHLSRCGSTLVSGCLAELDDTSVLSESPLLTGLLLDASLSDAQKQHALPRLIGLQAAPFLDRQRIVVKWNAWDLFAWPLIGAACPGVPRLLLFRDPEEILASHAVSAGRHMVGDPSLACVDPVFEPAPDSDLLDLRIRVLAALMDTMSRLAAETGALPIDYARLDLRGLEAICRHFGLSPDTGALERLARRAGRHSKQTDQAFAADGERKRRVFDADQRQRIHRALAPRHRALHGVMRERPHAGDPGA